IRLMGDMLVRLREGAHLQFGEAVIRDSGVTLPEHKFFGRGDQVFCAWSGTKVWSADGSFIIASSSAKKTYASISYMNIPNVHFMEHLIRTSFNNGKSTLSALLDS